MTGYEDLTWTTLNLVKRHLYRRLATPLNRALGRLAIARHITDAEEIRTQVIQAEQHLEVALNLLKSWAVLIHVKTGGTIRQEQRRLIAPNGLPAWLVEHLNGLTTFQHTQTRPVFVQAETFYESLVLLSLVGSRIGSLKKLVITDALDDDQRVSVRVVFDPPPAGPYTNLGALYKRFSTLTPAERETGFQLQVLQELLRLNGAALRLQNNQRSGEQALAARLWVKAFADDLVSPAQAQTGASVDEVQASLLAQFLQSVPEQLVSEPVEFSNHALEGKGASTAAGPIIHEPPIDNEVDTHIIPPVSFHERLAALFGAPPADPDAENDGDTLILHAQSFRERLAELTSALATAESNPENPPPEPGTIERVEPENASDTLIVPPPDLQRRLASQRPESTPESHSTEGSDQNTIAPTNEAVSD